MKKDFTGIFRGNEKGFGFVKIEDQEDEVYISRGNTKDAIDGDEVLIKIIEASREDKHQEGKVLKVLKHNKDTFVGVFQKSRNFGFVVPDDRKVNSDIFISKKNCGKAKNNQKVVAQITKFPQGNKSAEGKIIEILGYQNQAGVDMLSLVKEYDLPYEFPEPVIEEATSIKQEVAKKDIPYRLDLREKETFTIDGEDAKDLDDAVAVEKLKNGNYLLNVSIADVSYYVKENSLLDREAIVRGTSIYMLDRVIPMLPKELSNGICSLNQGEDRFALTVLMEIDQNGKVISSDIQKSIINVTRRMSYKEVQDILDELDQENPYFSHFKRMAELANILKQRRRLAGSLELDIPESKIVLDKHGIAVDVKKYEMYFTNELIEQFMLTANETVAEKFYWLEAPFIYRVHEVPDMEKIEELNKFLWNLGYKIKGSKDNIYPKAFAEVLEEIKGKPEERVISNLILRTLKIARYENENKGHFGIASKYYCHFTSPIRRYPDLFIHRIISRYLENNYQLTEEQLEKYGEQSLRYAESSSDREKIAQKVERDAEDIKKAEFMQDKIGEEYDGIISSITSFGVFVELENTVEGLIRFDDLGDEYFIYDENKKTLQGEESKKTYKIGDSIRIRVILADKLTRRIDFQLAVSAGTNCTDN
ncbi:MAG: ribonuclease R [Clostridia bacterium]|nr:ribonuclease R [Clostridia bacterium]